MSELDKLRKILLSGEGDGDLYLAATYNVDMPAEINELYSWWLVNREILLPFQVGKQ